MNWTLLKNTIKLTLAISIFAAIPAGAGRGVPDGILPLKSAGIAMDIRGEVAETQLRFDELGKTDLGQTAGFDCNLPENPLRLNAKGQLLLGTAIYQLDGVCVSENNKNIEYKIEGSSLNGTVSKSRRGKLINGNIEIGGNHYRVKLDKHIQ